MVETPDRSRPARWLAAGFGFAVFASPGMVWGLLGDPPVWVAAWVALSIGLGIVCWVVASILQGRAEGVSAIRIVGRALWAPIRFLLDLTF